MTTNPILYRSPAELAAPPPMDESRAVAVLHREFGLFDTAAEGGDADGRVSTEDLQAIRDRAPSGSERAEAASYLLDHPDALRRLDTAARGGDADGIVSREDARIAADDAGQRRMQALEIVNQDFALFDVAAEGGDADGKISLADLQAVRDGEGFSEAQRQAALFLLQHGGFRDTLDTAAQGSAGDAPDGVVSRDDIAAWMLSHPDTLPLVGTATVEGGAPAVLRIDAEPPQGAQWGDADNPAGTVSVYVDGAYYADATILSENGGRAEVNLGALPPGPHRIEVRDSSTGGSGGIRPGVGALELSTAPTPAGNQSLAARYAPVVRLINDDQAGNNTPLQTVARTTDNGDGTTTVAYSVLFSNEDGGYGEHPEDLADSWGRVTDDERLYSITFDANGTPIRFESHKDRLGSADTPEEVEALLAEHFAGGQPEVSIVDSHNKYGWTTPGDARGNNRAFAGAPLVVDGDASTIEVMNESPWLWQVSNRELAREDETDVVDPAGRLYLERDAGSFADVGRVEATLADGRRVVVHEGGLSDHDSVSIVLRDEAGNAIDPADVVSVRVVAEDGRPLDVDAQRLTPDYLPIHIPAS